MFKQPLFFLLLLFSTLTVIRAQCQDFPMLHYTIDNGLPSNNVYDIFRDSKGFLWISTDKGVAKYNGIKFETFTTADGLPDNDVFFTKQDLYGRIWFATYNGKPCFYQDGVFHNPDNTAFLRLPFKTSYIQRIKTERDSSITIEFFNQHTFINIRQNKCYIYNIESKNREQTLYTYIVNNEKLADGGFKVYMGDKIYYLDKNGKTINTTNSIYTAKTTHSFDQNREYLISNSSILSLEDNSVFRINRPFVNGDVLHRIYFDAKNKYYATNKGVIINDSLQLLADEDVSCITQDNVGNYWYSTLNNGIYSKYQSDETLHKNLYRGAIKYSCVRNGHLLFVTSDNNLYSFAHGMTTCLFDYGKYIKTQYPIAVNPVYLIDNYCRYFGIYNKDYISIDNVFSDKKTIKRYEHAYYIHDIKNIYPINNNIYVQNNLYVAKIDYYNLKGIGNYFAYTCPKDSVEISHRIFHSAMAFDSSIWYSDISNMYKFVDGQETIQPQFKNINLKKFILLHGNLIGYTQDNQLLMCHNIESNMMVDTVLFKNCILDKFYPLDDKHVLVSTNNLYQILTIKQATKGGKVTMNAIENPYVPTQAESICSDSSTCYFFKNGSLISVAIKSLLQQTNCPTLYFEKLKTGKTSYPITSDVTIPYSESKNIALLFETVSFSGKRISLEYSFSKTDQDNWQELNGDEVNLVNPGYGSFQIKLRAKTISSEYSQPAVLSLTILRPYWATWWFLSITVGALTTLIVLLIRHRIKRVIIKKEAEHNNEIKYMKSEYKALNALMNPHFIFNTLNNVQGLINKDEKRAANDYLRIFANLIRQNMHNISLELIPVQKELEIVVNYLKLEKLRFKDLLNYSINIDTSIEDLSEILIPPLLIQPLVENSIKHGLLPQKSKEGFIRIDIYERENYLVIDVSDNGIGIEASQKRTNKLYTSYGLENIRKRISQLAIIQNKQIKLEISDTRNESGNLQWTTVTISILIS